jgi:hypothetical protein
MILKGAATRCFPKGNLLSISFPPGSISIQYDHENRKRVT